MKKYLLATLATLALVAPAWAQSKVAVFDAPQVIASTNAAKRAATALEGRVKDAQTRINALEKPLLDKQKQLREQQAVMAADKFQQAQEGFAKDLASFRQQAQGIQQSLDDENIRLRKQIAEAVRTVVEQIAKEQKFDLVLPKGMVFFAGANVPDISAEVLKRANALLDK
jgi:outer membrane protein